MSDDALPQINLREELARIDRQRERDRVETDKMIAETRKLFAEQSKLQAEGGKLAAEERKLTREVRWLVVTTLSGMVAAVGVLTAGLTALLHWYGKG